MGEEKRLLDEDSMSIARSCQWFVRDVLEKKPSEAIDEGTESYERAQQLGKEAFLRMESTVHSIS